MAFTKILPAGISTAGTVTLERLETTNSIVSLGSTNQLYINTDTPTVRPTLDLNFERDQRLDSRITYSRNSTATYLGSDGLIKTALVNEPRFEFDTDGNCLGFLIEESRTNLVTYSENYDNAVWTKVNTIISANSTTAPDGTTTADTVTASAGSGFKDLYQYFTSSASANTTYTFSVFVKPNGIQYFTVVPYFNGASYASWFDLTAGTTLLNTSGNTSTITNLANGWYRCTVTRTSPATLSNAIFIVRPANANGDSTYIGNGSNGFYVWGAQLEQGSFPTSYIPTSGSTVTRSADNASITGTNFTDFYNASEGTLVLTADIGDLTVPNQNFVVIEDSLYTGQQFIAMGYRTGGGGSGYVASWLVDNQSNSAFFNHNASITSKTEFRHSFAYKQNDFAGSVNGSSVLTDTNGTVNSPTYTLNRVRFGQYYYGDTIDTGHIKRFTYYPQRLSNSQLQNLTS